jgi:tRNA 2-thiouridine synthesizing protein A
MANPLLDARDLVCPLPVLKARKLLAQLADGTVLEVHATDPASPIDFKAFCASTGHRFVSERETDGVYVFEIEKVGEAPNALEDAR